MKKLRVVEVFNGISGEVCLPGQGIQTTFVRLSGCNLKCAWCDTPHSQKITPEDRQFTPVQLFRLVMKNNPRHILITGGEPLLQFAMVDAFYNLLSSSPYFSNGGMLTIETNGSLFPSSVNWEKASFVMDYKLASSGMTKAMLPVERYVEMLGGFDYLKLPVATTADLNEAIRLLKGPWKDRLFTPAISPVRQKGRPVLRASVIVDRLWEEGLRDVILSVQIHKLMGLR